MDLNFAHQKKQLLKLSKQNVIYEISMYNFLKNMLKLCKNYVVLKKPLYSLRSTLSNLAEHKFFAKHSLRNAPLNKTKSRFLSNIDTNILVCN